MNEQSVKASLYKYLTGQMKNLRYGIEKDLDKDTLIWSIDEAIKFCEDTEKLMTTDCDDAEQPEEGLC